MVQNIDRIIELAKETSLEIDALLLAELYREKGDFNSCIQLLKGINGGKEYYQSIKEKVYSQAMVKDDKVFDISAVGIKMEYKCNNCEDSLVLFDLSKHKSKLEYKHYICKIENRVFNSQSKIRNSEGVLVKKKEIVCPCCDAILVEEFHAETDNCIKCSIGKYNSVVWF